MAMIRIKDSSRPGGKIQSVKEVNVLITETNLKREALITSNPLLQQASALVVCDNPSYMEADALRGKLKPARKRFWDRVTELIQPSKQAYDALIEFRHELVDPLDAADKLITGKMQDYKRLELAEKLRVEREATAESARLTREVEDKARAAEAARTKPMQTRLENQALKLTEQAIKVSEVKFEAVQGDASTTRTVTKWRVTDKNALLAAVIAGEVPEDVVEIDPVAMGKYFRFNREDFKSFPGVETYEDVEIASKRGRG